MIGEHTVAVGSVTEQAVRKNLATVRPPGTNGSATITPGVSYAGRSWSRLTTAVAGHGARLLVNAADLVNGQTYTASWLVANDGDAPVLVQIDWVDQNAPTALIAPGEVRRLYAPGSRATYDGTYRFSDLAIREVSSILFADVMVEAGDTDGAFFNGDTPDTPTADYAWTGAAGASTSTETGPVWSDISCLVDEVSINHGRDDSGSQPDASSATLTLSPDQTGALPLPAAVEIGATIRVTTTLAGTTYDRFVGRLTDISLGWDDAGEGTPDEGIGQLVATGVLADLGRRVIGDVPWPQELDGARVSRIMAAAGIALDPLYSDPGTVQILARDVDAQPALELAQGVAADAGGILWQTRSGVVRYADAEHRRGTTTSLALDACDTLVTPTWQRTTEGLINDVSIGYGAVPEGGEQPRTYASNAASIARYGEYAYSIGTQLAALADAQAMATLLMTRNSSPVWLLSALPVDVAGLTADQTAALLALDLHGLVSVTGLPAIGTAPTTAFLWVEGWREVLASGSHDIELAVSGYCRTSPPPRWDDVAPSWTWDAVGDVTWDDMTCLGPQPDYGRWADVPASLRWNAVPAATTWDTWD